MKEINNVEIMQQLVKGSQSIDRMKSEIVQVIRMVLGFLPEIDSSFPRTIVCNPKSKSCKLEVVNMGDYLVVECRFLEIDGGNLIFSLWPGGTNFRRTEEVQIVYEALPYFISGMLHAFPKLANKWEYLIKAADVFNQA
jgi:hypothetical protein